jgi:alkanesulfonate monooxygenase SsuD/methylene tetrahydromethanopterin reductase-like flavin-dependent oxidoreductase (luciferase family)
MTRALTFGYLYDFRNPEPWRRPWGALYNDILDIVAWTEDAGFGGAWVPEHHLADDGYMPSPLVALAAMAARTERIKLGTAIALAPLHHPMRFAEDCAVVSILAGGRLEVGLAIGYRRREAEAFGVDFSKRGRMFDEWLHIVTRLWRGETVDFNGQYYTLNGAKLMPPAPGGRMPLYIGGFADKSVERVIRYGDGYVGSDNVCLAYVDKLRELGHDPAAAKVRITGLMTVVAHDTKAAMDELAPYYHHVNNSYGAWFAEDQLGIKQAMAAMDLERFKASGILQILTPEAAIEMLRGLQQRMPLDHYMMMLPPGMPAERFIHYAEIFAKDVAPAFR